MTQMHDTYILEEYKKDKKVDPNNNYILEKYGQIGLVNFKMKLKEKENKNIDIIITASLTSSGKKYLIEKRVKNSIIHKLFNSIC